MRVRLGAMALVVALGSPLLAVPAVNATVDPGIAGGTDVVIAAMGLADVSSVTLDGRDEAALQTLRAYPPELQRSLSALMTRMANIAAISRSAADFSDVPAGLGSEMAAVSRLVMTELAPWAASASVPPIVVDPLLSIDLSDASTHYGASVVLQIDGGGDDTYTNSAGGTSAGPELGCGLTRPAAIAIDLLGNDRYVSGGHCGVNGGGYVGVGSLYDLTGHDEYSAGDQGVNGGGALGIGLLVDVEGSDRYAGGRVGVNGGGYTGSGTLLDLAGDDRYAGGSDGVNGGGSTGGAGRLLDALGNDSYTADGGGVNGGAVAPAAGLLVDGSGDDFYDSLSGSGANCSVVPSGSGAQLDAPSVGC